MEVAAEGLFDDDAPKLARGILKQPAFSQLVNDRTEEARGHGEIEDDAAVVPELFGEFLVGIRLTEIRHHVAHFLRHPAPLFCVDLGRVELGRLVRGEALHRFGERLTPAVVVVLVAIQADDFEVIREEVAAREIVERRHEQALGEIAPGTEDHQGAGRSRRDARGAVVVALGRNHGFKNKDGMKDSFATTPNAARAFTYRTRRAGSCIRPASVGSPSENGAGFKTQV